MTKSAWLIIAGLLLFFVLLYTVPIKAGTDWACRQGAGTASEYLAAMDKAKPRYWSHMVGTKHYQNMFILDEDGKAMVFVLVDQCRFTGKQIDPRTMVDLFDLDMRTLFPKIKKPVEKSGF